MLYGVLQHRQLTCVENNSKYDNFSRQNNQSLTTFGNRINFVNLNSNAIIYTPYGRFRIPTLDTVALCNAWRHNCMCKAMFTLSYMYGVHVRLTCAMFQTCW